MPTLKLLFFSLAKKMWPKVTAYALLGIASALMAIAFKEMIPDELSQAVGTKTADNILSILASSMLAVTTFSLTTIVSAYSAATSNATPRARSLITEDRTIQNVLSTFLGTFVFSLVGIIALNMGVYEGGGRFILFMVTLGIIVLIIVTFIRWIERLTSLGGVGETSALVEKATAKAMAERAHKPTYGCNRLEKLPENLRREYSLKALRSGYVQYFDVKKLSALADKNKADVYMIAMPGKYITKGEAIAMISKKLPESTLKSLQACITLADHRSFEQDPRFGLCVLAEIASRALSPALNDQGTAIDIVTRMGRVLEVYLAERKEPYNVECKRVWVPELCTADLFQDAFTSVVRDAAGVFEVQMRLQKILAHLGTLNTAYQKNARKYSRISLNYGREKLLLGEEKKELESIADALNV